MSRWIAPGAVALLLLAGAAPAHADIAVTTTDDGVALGDGHCTLREAIAAANAPGTPSADCPGAVSGGTTTITLGAGTFHLSAAPYTLELTGSSNVAIRGASTADPAQTQIDGGVDNAESVKHRILLVDSGAHVTISGLTLAHGHAADGVVGPVGLGGTGGGTGAGGGAGGNGVAGTAGADGGAISNAGTLALTNVVLSDDSAGAGGNGSNGGSGGPGGGYNPGSHSGGNGGNGGTGANGAQGGSGAAIYNTATLTVTDSAFEHSQAGVGGSGGAGGPGGTGGSSAAISASAPGIGGNGGIGGTGGHDAAGGSGGAIYNTSTATATLTRTTITDSAAGSAGVGGAGGPGGSGGDADPNEHDSTSAFGYGGAGGTAGSGLTGTAAGGSGGALLNAGGMQLTAVTIDGAAAGAGGSGAKGGSGGTGGSGAGGDAGGNGGAPVAGQAAGAAGSGGAISSSGTLTVTSSTIDSSRAGRGGFGGDGGAGGAGGPHFGSSPGGTSHNGATGGAGVAGGDGGAVIATGTATMTNVTLTLDAAGAGGNGGAGGDGGTVGADSALQTGGDAGAGAVGGTGGAIRTNTAQGLAHLTDVTIAANAAGAGGAGGIPGEGSPDGAAGANGNAGSDGGITAYPAPPMTSSVDLRNSIVTGNTPRNCFGVGDNGHDLSFSDTSCPGIHVDPKLAPLLADNGGPTKTLALGDGSPAIDAVPAIAAGCPTTDQRGVSRPYPAGGTCDIGAFERGPAPLCQDGNTTTTPGSLVGVTLGCSETTGAPLTYDVVSSPAHGSVTTSGGGKTVVYIPDPGFVGTDSFMFDATSVDGRSAPATAAVSVARPPAPTFGGTLPASPSSETVPRVYGSAPAGSTVSIYATPDCSGPLVGAGTAADFASPGILVTVPLETTTTLHANLIDAQGVLSDCSTDSITYTQRSTARDDGGDGTGHTPPKVSPPNTILVKHPKARLTVKTAKSKIAAAFTFRSPTKGATFTCKLDRQKAKTCKSPARYKVGRGKHTFTVTAKTAAGADPTPAQFKFTVSVRKRRS